MQRKTGFILGAAAVAAVFTAAGAGAGGSVWISSDGDATVAHVAGHSGGGSGAMFLGEDGEVFDLSELADGEVRVFGSGDKQVTVSRAGDEAVIERAANGDVRAVETRCRLATDTCQVLTFPDDPEKVMIVVRQSRRCEDRAGDCDAATHMAHVFVQRSSGCDGEDECAESDDVAVRSHTIRVASGGDPAELVVIEEAGAPFVFFGDTSRVTLACPEGDTTMRVDADEANDVFLCPKHSLPLEKQQRSSFGHFEFKSAAPAAAADDGGDDGETY
jgi:hypothetical protein